MAERSLILMIFPRETVMVWAFTDHPKTVQILSSRDEFHPGGAVVGKRVFRILVQQSWVDFKKLKILNAGF